MFEPPEQNESLPSWAKRNGIELGDEDPSIIGYWCRVSGVSLQEEAARRNLEADELLEGWIEAEEEIRDEIMGPNE